MDPKRDDRSAISQLAQRREHEECVPTKNLAVWLWARTQEPDVGEWDSVVISDGARGCDLLVGRRLSVRDVQSSDRKPLPLIEPNTRCRIDSATYENQALAWCR